MRLKAVEILYPNARYIDEELGVFDENNIKILIDENLVSEKITELQAEYDSKQYQRDRAEQYPSITDVVVALAEKEEGDDSAWQEISVQRAKVKKDYPKPQN